MQFKSKWVKSDSVLDNENSYTSVKYSIPIKPRIDTVMNRIDSQISKLEIFLNNLKSKYDEILQKVISSVQEKNNTRYYGVYLSDLVQTRKVTKAIRLSKIVFENLKFKLSRISHVADLVSTLSPVVVIVKNIRCSLVPYIPESQEEIGVISELLGGILLDAAQIGSYVINFNSANKEAVYMINEASLVAEQKVKEEFPDLPEHMIISSKGLF